MTIRQAKWVSRLYRLFPKTIGNNKYIGRVYYTAFIYSNYEIVSEISEPFFNTTRLDQSVLNYSDFAPFVDGFFIGVHFNDAFSKAYARSFTNDLEE